MRASISTCGSGLIQRSDQLACLTQTFRQVGDDQRVRARVGRYRTASREHRRGDERLHLFGARVAEGARQCLQLAGKRLRLGQLLPLRFLIGKHVQGCNAHDGSVDRVPEPVRPQDDVERLIPRHVAQRDVDGALNRRVDHDVQPADLRERAENRAQIGALKIEADRKPGELLRRRAGRLRNRGWRLSCWRRLRRRRWRLSRSGGRSRRRSLEAAAAACSSTGSRRRLTTAEDAEALFDAWRRRSLPRRKPVLRRRLAEAGVLPAKADRTRP